MTPGDAAAAPRADVPHPRVAVIADWFKRNSTWLSLGFTALVLAVAGLALHRLLANVGVDDVKRALAAITPAHLAACAGLTALSYLTLTGYDVLALRAIGRPDVPYRFAALGSFTAYTLSHNVGFAPITGSAARWRIYGPLGLEAGDIARIMVIAGVTFWLGIGLMLGIALVAHPGVLRIQHQAIPYAWQALLGVVTLLLLLGYLALTVVRRRPLKILDWVLPIPTTRHALLQFALAAVDITIASAALLVLVPGATLADLPAFVSAYVVAMMVALITHSPGGLGVFEAVMIVTLPHVDKVTLFSALLVYRLIYYLLPFAVSLLILLGNELFRLGPRRA